MPALIRSEVEPDRLADDVVDELKGAIREARLHVTVIHAGGAPVLADPRKLRQALANLVQNAVKFSPHGGEVLVEVTREPGRLRFNDRAEDDGKNEGESHGSLEGCSTNFAPVRRARHQRGGAAHSGPGRSAARARPLRPRAAAASGSGWRRGPR